VEDISDDKIELDSYPYQGKLIDVSGGQSSGLAQAMLSKRINVVHVEFDNLPEIENDYFYEGWLVRKEPFYFVSTGELTLEQDSNLLVNDFKSSKDLREYKFYVLTLEPDDGDPTPADHILEGTLTQ